MAAGGAGGAVGAVGPAKIKIKNYYFKVKKICDLGWQYNYNYNYNLHSLAPPA